MALKLLLGSLGLAVGVAATGGSVLPVVGMVVESTIATGIVGAGMYTASSVATGDWSMDGCLKAAGDSMLDGYMIYVVWSDSCSGVAVWMVQERRYDREVCWR